MQDAKDMDFQPGLSACNASTADSTAVSSQEHSTSSIGKFLSRHNSVSAEILARLLSHERLTSLHAVDSASTTRLASRIHYLKECGWPIKKREKATGCRDGRLAWVAEYYMPDEVIARAKLAGAAEWCTKVKAARCELRTNAVRAKQAARLLNALRGRAVHDYQLGLFAEVPE